MASIGPTLYGTALPPFVKAPSVIRSPTRTATLLLLVPCFAGCAGLMSSYNRYLENQILGQGNWDLFVEAQLTEQGVEGVVSADGCAEIESTTTPDPNQQPQQAPPGNGQTTGQTGVGFTPNVQQPSYSPSTVVTGPQVPTRPTMVQPTLVQPTTAPPAVQEPATETICRRFPLADARVRIVVGDVEITVLTDTQGRFAVTDGDDLAALTGAGGSGRVIASYQGRDASETLRFGGLDEVAALRLLDEMSDPSAEEIAQFVRDWAGTDAAELAMDRYGDRICGTFRADWSEMMATGDINRVNAVVERYDRDWRDTFCGFCEAECRALPGATDLAGELGSLGQ